ncbi:hypothetical protein [Streptomyces boluensis]|uniref:Uncharacterized protein n=1 Tax=Streptomyces boluensis TaxID=1775135 RepID=A0A964US93_9ACTN|nr:hypothetical protein [Streptomyces boluensis]NBE53832.1 hypothetical protein [Streptomyces boluensis]
MPQRTQEDVDSDLERKPLGLKHVLQHFAAILAIGGVLVTLILYWVADRFFERFGGLAPEEVGLDVATLATRAVSFFAVLAVLFVVPAIAVWAGTAAFAAWFEPFGGDVGKLVKQHSWVRRLLASAMAGLIWVLMSYAENPGADMGLPPWFLWLLGSGLIYLTVTFLHRVPGLGRLLAGAFLILTVTTGMAYSLGQVMARSADDLAAGSRTTTMPYLLGIRVRPVEAQFLNSSGKSIEETQELLYLGQSSGIYILWDPERKELVQRAVTQVQITTPLYR